MIDADPHRPFQTFAFFNERRVLFFYFFELECVACVIVFNDFELGPFIGKITRINPDLIDKFGDPLPGSSLDTCLSSDSVLLSAVGGPKWADVPYEARPEAGLLRLDRKSTL